MRGTHGNGRGGICLLDSKHKVLRSYLTRSTPFTPKSGVNGTRKRGLGYGPQDDEHYLMLRYGIPAAYFKPTACA